MDQELHTGDSTRPIHAYKSPMNNQGEIALAKDNKFHARTKHINLRHHFIREAVEEEKIKVIYIPTEENIVDIFTKALARLKYEGCVERLGLREEGGRRKEQ